VLQAGDLTAGSRRTARHAFPGDDVKLSTEFQVGITDPQNLASQLVRAQKTLDASVKCAADIKKDGWLPADSTAIETALEALGTIALDQDEAIADRAQFTGDLTRAANTLYKITLSAQNAARLQYPSTASTPGVAGARVRFLLDTFSPRDRSQPDPGPQPQKPNTITPSE
jgi:hypothetical protein